MRVAEEQLTQVAPHVAKGVLDAAEHDGVTLAEICERLETYGQPPLQLTSVARRRYEGGTDSHVLVTWLGPAGTKEAFDELGKAESSWYESPSHHEFTRIFTQYGLAIEDVHGMSEYRNEYLKFLNAYSSKKAKSVRTVHVAADLAERIGDPLAASQDPKRLEDAYERFALGLLVGKLFGANEDVPAVVASLRELVETSPTYMRSMLPSPVSKEHGRYRLADYRLKESGNGERVRLDSGKHVDLGSSITEAVDVLIDGAEGRARAIEVLAEQVLSAGGPFAKRSQDAVAILQTFLGVLQKEMKDADDATERDALGRLCQEIQEEIAERQEADGDRVFRVNGV